MGDYILKHDGTEFPEVEGTKDWAKIISRDFRDRIFRTKGDFLFTGWGALYNLLYNNTVSTGVCNALEGRVYFRPDKSTAYTEWFRGEMKPQDNKFDLINISAEGNILEDTWAAKFNNSQDQKVFLRSTQSKNGVFIPACVTDLCDFFDPGDPVLGNYAITDIMCFRIFEVFTFLVAYHTDGLATFTSTFFDLGGGGEQYFITTGHEIIDGNNDANPEVSFSTVFKEMNKKLNLWIIIEGTFDAPVLRIEPMEYVFGSGKVLEVNNPENINLQIDLDRLYTIIKVGSKAIDYDGNTHNYPNIRFESWNDENYNTAGDCEFENNTLDLVSDWIIDTNSLESVVDTLTPNTDLENNIFLVEIDPTTLDADKFTTELTGTQTVDYIYNKNLINSAVITNWFDGIPQQLIKAIGPERFVYANQPTATAGIGATSHELDFTNDSIPPASDRDDIYTTAAEAAGADSSGEFKVPENNIFAYEVEAFIDNIIGGQQQHRLVLDVYEDNTRTTQLQFIPGTFEQTVPGGSRTLNESGFVTLETNNVVVMRIIKLSAGGFYDLNSGFGTLSTTNPVYEIATTEPLLYNYDIERFNLSLADFNTLENNLGFIRFVDEKTGRKWDLWAKELKYDPLTRIAGGEFVGRPPIAELCWVLFDGTWHDECYWSDTETWID